MGRAVFLTAAVFPVWIALGILFAVAIFSCLYGHAAPGVPKDVREFVEVFSPNEVKAFMSNSVGHATDALVEFVGSQNASVMNTTGGRAGLAIGGWAESLAVGGYYFGKGSAGVVARWMGRRAITWYAELVPNWVDASLNVAIPAAVEGTVQAYNQTCVWWEDVREDVLDAVQRHTVDRFQVPAPVKAWAAIVLSAALGFLASFWVLVAPAKSLMVRSFRTEFAVFEERLDQRVHIRGFHFSVRNSEIQFHDIVVTNPRQFTHMAGFLLKIKVVRCHLRTLPLLFGRVHSSGFLVEDAMLQYKPGLKPDSPCNVQVALTNLRAVRGGGTPPTKVITGQDADTRFDWDKLPRNSFEVPVKFVLETVSFTKISDVLCSIVEHTLEECLATYEHNRLLTYPELTKQRALEAAQLEDLRKKREEEDKQAHSKSDCTLM